MQTKDNLVWELMEERCTKGEFTIGGGPVVLKTSTSSRRGGNSVEDNRRSFKMLMLSGRGPPIAEDQTEGVVAR